MTKKYLLADLVKMDEPDSVLSEIKIIICKIHPSFDFQIFEQIWNDLISMYRGEYPGYRACTTYYHDLQHTTDCVIALARLIHGAHYSNLTFTHKEVEMGLVSALFHDVGYILEEDDPVLSGGAYTPTHIQRGIKFISTYLLQHNYTQDNIDDCANMMLCTGLENQIPDIPFRCKTIKKMGQMLGSADLIGQMGDRTYLEKLPFLYREFLDANIGAYKDEFDFFEKSLGFYQMILVRLEKTLDNCHHYSKAHFEKHNSINEDLYSAAMKNNMDFLGELLEKGKTTLYSHLKRAGRMELLKEIDEKMDRSVY